MSLTQLTILPEENNFRHPSLLCAKINFSYIIILNIPDIEVVEAGFEPRSVSCLCANIFNIDRCCPVTFPEERHGREMFSVALHLFL